MKHLGGLEGQYYRYYYHYHRYLMLKVILDMASVAEEGSRGRNNTDTATCAFLRRTTCHKDWKHSYTVAFHESIYCLLRLASLFFLMLLDTYFASYAHTLSYTNNLLLGHLGYIITIILESLGYRMFWGNSTLR